MYTLPYACFAYMLYASLALAQLFQDNVRMPENVFSYEFASLYHRVNLDKKLVIRIYHAPIYG